MKIYSDKLTEADVRTAVHDARQLDGADIMIEDLRTWTPRSHRNGIEMWLYADHGKFSTGRNQGPGPRGEAARAASWDAWGHVIARLFAQDPDARVGWYDGVDDFITKVRQANRPEPKGFLDKVGNCCESCEGTV
jgi:hypothetical protein